MKKLKGKELKRALGRVIRSERQAQNLTQVQLAQLCRLTQASVSNNEVVGCGSLTTLMVFSNVLQVPLAELVRRAEDKLR